MRNMISRRVSNSCRYPPTEPRERAEIYAVEILGPLQGYCCCCEQAASHRSAEYA